MKIFIFIGSFLKQHQILRTLCPESQAETTYLLVVRKIILRILSIGLDTTFFLQKIGRISLASFHWLYKSNIAFGTNEYQKEILMASLYICRSFFVRRVVYLA